MTVEESLSTVAGSSLLREVARRTAWITAGTAVGRLMPLAGTVLLSRTLGLEGYATVGTIVAWGTIAGSITTAGTAAVTAQALAGVAGNRAAASSIIRKSMIAAMLAVAVLVAALCLSGPQLMEVILPGVVPAALGGIALAIGVAASFFQLFHGIFNGLHKPRSGALLLAGCGALQGAALAQGAYLASAENAIVLYALALGVATLAGGGGVLLQLPPPSATPGAARGSPVSWPGFIKRAVVVTVGTGLVAPVTFFCASLLADEVDGRQQLGAFFLLEQLHGIIVYLPMLIAQSSLPVLASELGRKGSSAAITYMRNVLIIKAVAALALAVVGYLLTDVVLGAYGADFASFDRAYHFMLLNAVLMVPLASVGVFVIVRGAFLTGCLMNLLWAVVFVALSLTGQDDGCAGIQLARLMATTVLGIFSLGYMAHYLRKTAATTFHAPGAR